MGGKINTERPLRIKTMPNDVAIVTPGAFINGAIAEIALPPQMEVPKVMRIESGEGILNILARKAPSIRTNEMLKKVISIPSKPALIID